MYLSALYLFHFRNYEDLRLDFGSRLNVFVGQNAQGKTNLLEAIFLLSTARSPRVQFDREMIRWGEEQAAVEGAVEKASGPVSLRLNLFRQKRKRALVNSNDVPKLSDFMGFLNAVFFSPDDLQLVKGAPSLRRRFIDQAVAQVDSSYRRNLFTYQRALMERNSLLKSGLYGNKVWNDEWQVWTEQLISSGVRLMHRRQEALRQISARAEEIQNSISGEKETLRLVYESSFLPPGSETDPASMEQCFWEKVTSMKRDEARRGLTLVGPHRDDLRLEVNGRDLRLFGSQGQQRTAALSLKIAELEFMKGESGEYPVLLLDDVLSELDEDRRRDLLDLVRQEVQIFVTGTDISAFQPRQLQEGQVFQVREGNVAPLPRTA